MSYAYIKVKQARTGDSDDDKRLSGKKREDDGTQNRRHENLIDTIAFICRRVHVEGEGQSRKDAVFTLASKSQSPPGVDCMYREQPGRGRTALLLGRRQSLVRCEPQQLSNRDIITTNTRRHGDMIRLLNHLNRSLLFMCICVWVFLCCIAVSSLRACGQETKRDA